MPEKDKTVAELQAEMDRLGIEPAPLQEDTTLEASLSDENGLDAEPDLSATTDKKVEEETPAKVPNNEFLKQKAVERAERRGSKIQALEEEIGGVKTTLNEIVGLLKKDKQAEAEDKFAKYAEKHNLDPEGIKELVSIIKEDIGVVPPEEQPKEPEFNELEQREVFETEFEEILPEIEKEFPKATATQIKQVEKMMAEISVSSPLLAESDLIDIFYSPKYYQQFKEILYSPNKKTFEAGRTAEKGELVDEDDLDNMVIDTPEKALKAQKALWKATGGNTAKMYETASAHSSDVS